MTQDVQVIKNVVSRFVVAGKDPRIIAINRLMAKVKPAVAAYLTDKTGIPWTPSSYVDEKSLTFLSYTEHRCIAAGNRFQWFVSFRFAPKGQDPNVQLYEMTVTAEKGQRILDSFRKEDVNLTDIRRPDTIITPAILKALSASFGGDYSKEIDEIKDYLNNLLVEAQDASTHIKALSKIVASGEMVEAFKSSELFELESAGRSIQSGAQYVKSQLKTITEGR
jgi:hypothetical protein